MEAVGNTGNMQFENEKYNRYVCCTLNIITPQNFDTLLKNTLELIGNDKSKMDIIIDMVFKNSSSNSLYSEVYSKLCSSILTKFQQDSKEDFGYVQKRVLWNFDEITTKIILEERETIPDENRYHAFCTLAFIAHLFHQEVISLEKIKQFMDQLIYIPTGYESRQIIDFRLDCFIKVVEIAGKRLEELDKKLRTKYPLILEPPPQPPAIAILEERPKSFIISVNFFLRYSTLSASLLADGFSADKKYTNTLFDQLDKLTKTEGLLSTRIYYLLLGVMELRENSWKPRLETLKPLTIEQIRKKVEDEIERRNQEIMYWRKQRKAST